MNASQNMKSGSSFEQQISSINMSQDARDQVLQDARIAQLFVDAIVWVGGKFERLNTGGFAKPSLKY